MGMYVRVVTELSDSKIYFLLNELFVTVVIKLNLTE